MPKSKDLESKLTVLERQLGVFQRISRLMVRELSLAETLQSIVNLVTQFTACDSTLLYLIDCDHLVLCASSNPHPSQIGRVRLRLDEGLTGWVARERKMLAIASEAYSDPRFRKFSDLPEDNFESFLSVPVIARNRVIGVINVHHREEHEYAPEAVSLLTFIGEQMGGAVARAHLLDENLRLHEETLEMKRQLETRKLVERAKGILQFKYNLTEEEAYLRLRNESRRLRRPMRDLAEAIILTEDLARKSGEPASLEREVEGD
ncbi:MAG TPA: GAF domain-containing protein [Bryobacteraceae bacterium]|nr:GAF domain-containing protein [Bryobacteraceae bacterium]